MLQFKFQFLATLNVALHALYLSLHLLPELTLMKLCELSIVVVHF